MPITDHAGDGLHGRFRDVLRDGAGEVRWDSGWLKNAIVTDFRRVLAGFIRGAPPAVTGIVGLRVGAGLAAWDSPPGPPPATPDATALVDPAPFTVARGDLQIDFVDPVTGPPARRPPARSRSAPRSGRTCRHGRTRRTRPARFASSAWSPPSAAPTCCSTTALIPRSPRTRQAPSNEPSGSFSEPTRS